MDLESQGDDTVHKGPTCQSHFPGQQVRKLLRLALDALSQQQLLVLLILLVFLGLEKHLLLVLLVLLQLQLLVVGLLPGNGL